MNDSIDPEIVRSHLIPLARGSYQLALLRGDEAWSGATLRGKASKYGGRYASSRAALLARIAELFPGSRTELRLNRNRRYQRALVVVVDGMECVL